MSPFISGLVLNKHFFFEVIKPILDKAFPNLSYTAARIGFGSDVLGFDTQRSTDHDWGPRLELFLTKQDFSSLKEEISIKLSEELPSNFMGYSTNFGEVDENGVRILESSKDGIINHRIEFYTIQSFFKRLLERDPYQELSEIDWLAIPEQRLLAITNGTIYYDDLKLQTFQDKFSYYPSNVWYYLLQKQWSILGEESAFPGRVAEISDDLGSHLIAINQISKLMKLCFLMEKKYAPYSKWFSFAFSRLDSGVKLLPLFKKIISAKKWIQREKYLTRAYTFVAELHNRLKITEPIEIKITPFHDRPYLIINFNDFARKISEKIADNSLLKDFEIGSIDQISNETYILENLELINSLYNHFK